MKVSVLKFVLFLYTFYPFTHIVFWKWSSKKSALSANEDSTYPSMRQDTENFSEVECHCGRGDLLLQTFIQEVYIFKAQTRCHPFLGYFYGFCLFL